MEKEQQIENSELLEQSHFRDSYPIRVDNQIQLFFRNGKTEFVAALEDIKSGKLKRNYPFHYYHCFGEHTAQPPVSALQDLGKAMRSTNDNIPSCIPAGYTYLGQFLFHDITWFDLPSNDPLSFATPQLDLDSVLGNSRGCPLAYDNSGNYSGGPLSVGYTKPFSVGGTRYAEDLPRSNGQGSYVGCPIIPDKRNDDFLALAQIHLLFIKFFNAVAARHGYVDRDTKYDEEGVYKEYIDHVHCLVLKDYLPRIIDTEVYFDVLTCGRKFIHPGIDEPIDFEIPIEFAAAGARFGHSMIRPSYVCWSDAQRTGSVHHFMENSFRNCQSDRPFDSVPNDWITKWDMLFDFDKLSCKDLIAASKPLTAAPIDTMITEALTNLPMNLRELAKMDCSELGNIDEFDEFDDKQPLSLPVETLMRQRSLNMAPAEEAIRLINAKLPVTNRITPLTQPELTRNEPCKVQQQLENELKNNTPIWFYILKEAEVRGKNNCLGPFGSRLVMETMHAVMSSKRDSIINNPKWKPTIPALDPDYFSMTDLIRFSI